MTKTTKDLTKLSDEERRLFADKYDNFFFDIDGTLSDLTKKPFNGVQEVISSLAADGKEIYIFTDNCTVTRDALYERLKLSYPELKKKNVLNPGVAIVQHLKNIGITGKIYVVAERQGVLQELINAGFDVEFDEVIPEKMSLQKIMSLQLDENVTAVVIGVDFNFSYLKLTKACNYLTKPGLKFYVTHPDRYYTSKPSLVCAGGLALTIQEITGVHPEFCGKASDIGMDIILGLGVDMKRSIFVGDHYQSDILTANKCGMDSILVLTGLNETFDETSRPKAPLFTPTYFANGVADLRTIYGKNK